MRKWGANLQTVIYTSKRRTSRLRQVRKEEEARMEAIQAASKEREGNQPTHQASKATFILPTA